VTGYLGLAACMSVLRVDSEFPSKGRYSNVSMLDSPPSPRLNGRQKGLKQFICLCPSDDSYLIVNTLVEEYA